MGPVLYSASEPPLNARTGPSGGKMELGRWAHMMRVALIVFLAGGCAPAIVVPSSAAPGEFPGATFTAIPTFTPAPPTNAAPTQARAATQPAETAAGTPYVVVSADNVNLRTRPGTVFPVSRLLAKGSRLELLGHAPGNEWLYVQTDSKVYGWVLAWLVSGGHDGGAVPEVEPADVLIVKGQVVDRSGAPISGVGFAVTQGTAPSQLRTDATTDQTGTFYAYLPTTSTGTWLVSYVSIACTSNTMDSSCNCIGSCGKPDPGSVTINMPPQGVLQFVWK